MKSKDDKMMSTMADMEKHGRGASSDTGMMKAKGHKPKMKKGKMRRSTHKGHPD
jgi:hypothetical protein